MAKITKPSTSTRNPTKRHSTASIDSPVASDPTKDSMKNRKAQASHVRASKARASMACERCKHKKVKCEDYVEGQGCEKCRMNNEICYFHRKEVEIKTSFRQGYVENCERECEHLKELVVRIYKEASEGSPIKTVELVAKDGYPNITALMHAYGVGLGADFLGSYEAREARLASEGQPVLTHNGKGDIVLPRESGDPHHVLPSVEESSSTETGHDRAERMSHPSRSPSPDHYTSTNSQPMSRQSSTGSLFSNHSIPRQQRKVDEDMADAEPAHPRARRSLQEQRMPVSPSQQLRSNTLSQTDPVSFSGADNGVDSWLNVKRGWAPSTPFPGADGSSSQGFTDAQFSDGFLQNKSPTNRLSFRSNATSSIPQFQPSRQQQPISFGFVPTENMFQTDMQQGFSESLSPEDMQMPVDGFFADNFMQPADSSVPFDYLENPVF